MKRMMYLLLEQNVRRHILMKFPRSGEGVLVYFSFRYHFLALWILTNIFGNANAIPGMIFIGALLVPISGLIFFFESNAFKTLVSLM